MPSKPFVVRSRSVLVGITDSQFVGFATAVSANVKWIAAALSDTTVAAVIRLEGTQGNLRFMRMANTEAKQFELTVDIWLEEELQPNWPSHNLPFTAYENVSISRAISYFQTIRPAGFW